MSDKNEIVVLISAYEVYGNFKNMLVVNDGSSLEKRLFSMMQRNMRL